MNLGGFLKTIVSHLAGFIFRFQVLCILFILFDNNSNFSLTLLSSLSVYDYVVCIRDGVRFIIPVSIECIKYMTSIYMLNNIGELTVPCWSPSVILNDIVIVHYDGKF